MDAIGKSSFQGLGRLGQEEQETIFENIETTIPKENNSPNSPLSIYAPDDPRNKYRKLIQSKNGKAYFGEQKIKERKGKRMISVKLEPRAKQQNI